MLGVTIFGLTPGWTIAIGAMAAIALMAGILIFRSRRIAAAKQGEPVEVLKIHGAK